MNVIAGELVGNAHFAATVRMQLSKVSPSEGAKFELLNWPEGAKLADTDSVTVLACKQSWDGQALVLRLQETCGRRLELCDPRDPRTPPFIFRPFEIKTLRLEPGGAWHEVALIRETDSYSAQGTKES